MSQEHTYTEVPIKGEFPKLMLPKGTGLVLEGGGTRGFFTAGVFEAFMEHGVMFPYIVGVSAGPANAMSYVSGQKFRNRQIIEKYVGRHQYVSFRNLLKHRSLFGYEYIFKTIPGKHIFWDREVFYGTDISFLIGAFEINTAETVWFEKHELGQDLAPSIASCSVPIVSRIVRIGDMELLDGGIAEPIPVRKSVSDGNSFHVIILTRNANYKHGPMKNTFIVKLLYKKYPLLVETLLRRHEIYNNQIMMAEKLEQEGKALIIRPQKPLSVGRSTSDTKALVNLHDEGFYEGKKALRVLAERLGISYNMKGNKNERLQELAGSGIVLCS